MKVLYKERKRLLEESYEQGKRLWVVAAGLTYVGVVVDINPDWSFVLKAADGDTNTFYDDEVWVPDA